MLNNPDKISPSLYLNLEEITIDGKLVLWVYIPMSSQVEFCNKKIFDRNGDSDQDITKSSDLVANLYNRKSSTYHEREIFPYVTTDHLNMELLTKVRQMAVNRNPNHPWKDMDDMALMRNAVFMRRTSLLEKKALTWLQSFFLEKMKSSHLCVLVIELMLFTGRKIWIDMMTGS